jgi:YidC/Oxa1 family membrane protein insertase
MEGIFFCIDKIGIPNIGLAIILFTLVINLLMLPLTIKQQKFAKLSAKMNPEIQAIQAKYKGKKDNDSNIAQNAEIQAVYAKYGVSPTGSCMYLIIQMPILFALYRVIYAMPAYVTKIGDTFRVLAEKIIEVDGGEFLKNSGIDSIASTVSAYGRNMTDANLKNGIVDVLNKLSSSDMSTIASHYDLSQLTYKGQLILSNDTTRGLIDTYNNFLGLNIGNSPWYIMKEAFSNGAWLLAIGAIAIPVLSALSQWINVKLMPQQDNSSTGVKNEQAETMASSMKTMNMMMPLMSAYFCFTLPSGMGLYWVAGSVVRSIQQVIINKHIDKMDIDEIIKKNSIKSQKKLEKQKEQQEKLNAYANMNTRNIKSKANITTGSSADSDSDINVSGTYNETNPGSMMSKANKVKKYNEKNR